MLCKPIIRCTWNRSLDTRNTRPSNTTAKSLLPLYISLPTSIIFQRCSRGKLPSHTRLILANERGLIISSCRGKDGERHRYGGFELHQIHELARKLNENLQLSHNEICRTLAKEIICAIEKTICTAKSSSSVETELAFFNGREFHVDRLNKEFSDNEPKKSKKRKMMANGTIQVRVSSDPGADMPPDDGHSWRKYGQKDILGAKHPRSYYRCTHRKTQGCAAMKQVQKTDENSSIYDITYLGTHTCFNSPQQIASKTRFYNPQQSLLDQQNCLLLHLGFETNLKLKTEISDLENQDPTSSFSFPSTPIEGKSSENVLFCSSPRTECGYGVNLSSALMSPTSYESNCFTWPSCEVSSEVDYALTEIISASNSVADLPVMDVEFMRDYEEMDAEILFDTSIFFE